MNAIIASLLALIFGIHADAEKAKSDASCCVAYAVVAKEEKKPEPKPDGAKPKEPEVKPEPEDCLCGPECKCKDCKCPNCKHFKWNWKQTGELTGNYQKVQGEKVLETRKYVRKRIERKVCTKRGCQIVIDGHTPWAEVK